MHGSLTRSSARCRENDLITTSLFPRRYFRPSRNNTRFPSSRADRRPTGWAAFDFSSTRFPVLRNLCPSLLPSFLPSFSLVLSFFLSFSLSLPFIFYEYKRVRALVSSTIISIMRLMVKCKSFNKCNIVRPSQKSVRNRANVPIYLEALVSLWRCLHRVPSTPIVGKDLLRARLCDRRVAANTSGRSTFDAR